MNTRHNHQTSLPGRRVSPTLTSGHVFGAITTVERYDARMRATNPHLCPVFIEPPPVPWPPPEWDDDEETYGP